MLLLCYSPTFKHRALARTCRVKPAKILFLCTVAVSLYITVISFALLGRSSPRAQSTRRRAQEEDDETIEIEVVHFKGLSQHTWAKNCQRSFEQLCNYPIFPNAPDKRNFVENVNITSSENNVDGFRFLGFLRPNASGEYFFSITSNGFAEIWLSTTRNWKKGRKIAYTRPQGRKSTSNSTGVNLSSRRMYYIDILYASGAQKKEGALIQLAWKRPNTNAFELIDRAFFSPYKNDSDKAQMKVYDDDLPDVLACAALGLTNKHMKPETLTYLESSAVGKALDFCKYKPSYLLNPANLNGFGQYHGVYKHAHKTFSFPYSNVDGIVRNERISPAFKAENPLEEQEARSVVNRYMAAVNKTYPGKYKLESLKRVEKKQDHQKGNRYLLELVVKNVTDGTNYILSEYVFLPNVKNASLCYPTGLQWNRTADVYLILTAKNLGRWVHHFIKNVEKIIQETKDEHVHVVIYDFESPDINLKEAFQRSTIKNYHFIIKPGKYSRTESLSKAVQSIKNPDAIIVTIDLHLDIGSQLINDVRKHCSKGRTVYAPQIVFLNCGGSSALPRGVWYHYSYGTIAMYKQDWVNFGGFSQRFVNKTSWGGEDWDIIDGAVKSGLEIERKRSPGIYHYHHTKDGMWKKAQR